MFDAGDSYDPDGSRHLTWSWQDNGRACCTAPGRRPYVRVSARGANHEFWRPAGFNPYHVYYPGEDLRLPVTAAARGAPNDGQSADPLE